MVTTIQQDIMETLESYEVRDLVLLAKVAIRAVFVPGLGFTSSDSGPFGKAVWSRDVSILALLEADLFPMETLRTLRTIIERQDKDSGRLPIRVANVDNFSWYISHVLGLERFEKLHARDNEPWYEHSIRAVPARDTTYSVVSLAHSVYHATDTGRQFVKSIFHQLMLAMHAEEKYVDRNDQMVVSRHCSNWADCINQKGKLSSINLMRLDALRKMASLARAMSFDGMAGNYTDQARILTRACDEKLWDQTRGCFMVSESDDRLDTFANLYFCLTSSDTLRAIQILRAIKKEATHSSGLVRCFSKAYPWWEVNMLRTAGMKGYGNTFLYPLFTDLYVIAEAKVASRSKDFVEKRQHLYRALERFHGQTELYLSLGTFHEVLDPGSLQPAEHWLFPNQFHSHSGFMPAAVAYLAAYNALLTYALGPTD